MFVKQYEVWEALLGKPRKVRCTAAIGMRRVKIDGIWYDRDSNGLYNTELECQKAIDEYRKSLTFNPDPMFVPVIE